MMKIIKVAILEDEIEEQKVTLSLLQRFFDEHNINFEYVKENNPHEFLKHDFSDFDLILLDILMPYDINGFDVSKKIREANDKIAIIFLTKTLNYAINGYEVQAMDYMLKPLIYEDFALKMSVFLKTKKTSISKIHAFKCKEGSIVKISEEDIIYIDAFQHYLNIHTPDKVYVSRGNIKDVEKYLSNMFSRCSLYYIVNFLHLGEIKKDDVILKNGERLKITSTFKKSFLKDFSSYLLNHD